MFTVYFPQEPGAYAVVYFIGGLGGYAPVEFYSIFMSKLASHGFFVFGVDYAFPVEDEEGNTVGEDVNKYFAELSFVSYQPFNIKGPLFIRSLLDAQLLPVHLVLSI